MKKFYTVFTFFISFSFFGQAIDTEIFAQGFFTPVEITHAGDDRLFVVELGGDIRVIAANGSVYDQSFLSLPEGTVLAGAERGLLGLAFHPQYASNGYFYICYTRVPDGSVMIVRYSVNPENPNVADPSSAFTIMAIPHLETAHNGGTLRFGPDGYLYIGIGDGWAPLTNAQDINVNLGKILRVDINNSTETQPYAIPPGNPYVGVEGNDEIWAIGLRNPWKYSFDKNTGDLWIADVGNTGFEEINHVSSTISGINYGWSCFEANAPFSDCETASFTFPFLSYPHEPGRCSIIGGYVYAGTEFPAFNNKYFFGDLCANAVLMADITSGEVTSSAIFPGDLNYFMTLGQDNEGEVYIAAAATGTIYKIVNGTMGTNVFGNLEYALLPNPAQSEFRLTNSTFNYPAELVVHDATGKTLIHSTLLTNDSSIPVDALQNGIYLVTVTDQSGAVGTSKLVVSK